MKKIDFEAHFYTKEYIQALYDNPTYPNMRTNSETGKRRLWYHDDVGQPFAEFLLDALYDLGEGRIKKMDENGIETQILSLSAPGLEQFDPDKGTKMAIEANNALAAITKKHPGRIKGYAALAPKNPQAAADELERAVKELGFVGWNTHSNYGDSYIDDPKYFPILERAAKLNVPIYIHPTVPAIPHTRSYGFALAGAPFGFGLETALAMMRLIYSGAFDKCPNLKIILGHLGEGLSFVLKRMDWAYVRPFDPAARPALEKMPSDYMKNNVWVTTSGNYYEPAFRCTYEALGIDRIILGTDYPYEDAEECIEFVDGLWISPKEKEMIYYENAKQILSL